MEQRTEFALRAMRTLNFRALCQEYGISAKTGYKWRERFRRKGLAGMEEESRRPKSHSKQLQKGMNYGVVKTYSVFLMSLRMGAPYADALDELTGMLTYEGHDCPQRLT